MKHVNLFFQVHQPMRLRKLSIFDESNLPHEEKYFDFELNEHIFNKVASKCYLPANKMMLDLIHSTDGAFKASYSLTGVFIEQCMKFNPKVFESFEELAATGCVDFLSETYYHSLASLYADKKEFVSQVHQHKKAIAPLCKKPVVFRNTEALYSNEIAGMAAKMGFKGIITEGHEGFLEWRSPNHVYKAKDSGIKVLLRNYKLSDDVSYRFSARWWEGWPLTADKFSHWLSQCNGDCINLYMDYETFGEHQWEDTGIFEFFRHFPGHAFEKGISFHTARDAVNLPAVGEIDVPNHVSWADMERDASAWLGNEMQRECFRLLQDLVVFVDGNKDLERVWRLLQSSDHFYYMCTKCLADGDVHKYFSHYDDPYESFINYMNILQDFRQSLRGELDG